MVQYVLSRRDSNSHHELSSRWQIIFIHRIISLSDCHYTLMIFWFELGIRFIWNNLRWIHESFLLFKNFISDYNLQFARLESSWNWSSQWYRSPFNLSEYHCKVQQTFGLRVMKLSESNGIWSYGIMWYLYVKYKIWINIIYTPFTIFSIGNLLWFLLCQENEYQRTYDDILSIIHDNECISHLTSWK